MRGLVSRLDRSSARSIPTDAMKAPNLGTCSSARRKRLGSHLGLNLK